ncbi:unnamed protein product (macronuclear) [Paramecium tetraurelia]|uniref:TLDc domain-containing protein n=1 Tax=Paramecium tetraurelia TaxID=5888 RepID=A0BCD3_PARTE|nr:uncharacterized protein GSPATT00004294001 [Paramecium tetraurelia]CAK56200.1 unnamed protein product [Paramecium tetraurelia]|eukprot:XP_001423598.1 hypothetical protein (macronuclear) [Paramecium tetraurelia strain d4-2]
MDNLCTVCINQRAVNRDFECKSYSCDENSRKGNLETCQSCNKKLQGQNQQQNKKKADELIKVCQRSISFIHNQQIYMKQFIEHQIGELINMLQEKQNTLQSNLTEILQKKLDYYQDCESRLNIIKKNSDYNRLKQQPFVQLEQYEDDKILDFGNIKILTEEIKNFGKRVAKKTNQSACLQINNTKKYQNNANKENLKDSQEKINQSNMFISFLPSLDDATLIYRFGQKFHMPKQNKVLGFIYTTNQSKFGFYYNIDQPTNGYNNSKDCYIFSLNNIYQIPPMKFYPKEECHSKIGFGKDCKDLLIDFENIKNSSSNLGQSYDVYSELDSECILAGRSTNWNVEMIEIFSLK